jgi:hypothetical protein
MHGATYPIFCPEHVARTSKHAQGTYGMCTHSVFSRSTAFIGSQAMDAAGRKRYASIHLYLALPCGAKSLRRDVLQVESVLDCSLPHIQRRIP